MPLLLHGDAAFAGQGVVAECFAMSGTKGFRTGGTIHFVVNNQIGFTTSPAYARSSPYPSDVALMVQAPIFHVNGDDPEAVVHVARIATEFRQLFHKDVVIDMFCYRRFGHNETDEPSFTQPLMYRAIKDHPTALELYAAKLVSEGTLTEDDVRAMIAAFQKRLDEELDQAKNHRPNRADWLDGRWSGFAIAPEGDRRGETAVPLDALMKVGHALSTAPDHSTSIAPSRASCRPRRKCSRPARGSTGPRAKHSPSAHCSTKAAPSGFPDRIRRAAHSPSAMQRSSIRKPKNVIGRSPISAKARANSKWWNSLLSEEAVLGFEYGYSSAEPRALVLWEAQFGDFANGAQVVIDQFIASGEMKWLRMCGLVMLLPHGYEGQGPEHSSARLERYLQLCAQDNIQVAYCTTPANYFHVLRRQVHRPFRKPLILMTPKSLLRNKHAISFLSDMQTGSSFHRVFRDQAECVPGATTVKLVPDDEIKRVILCTGKVYFDLMEEREKRNETRIQMLRIEQLYPFPEGVLAQELARFPKAEVIWCQEEPKNQGAWTFIAPRIEMTIRDLGGNSRPRYVGRPEYASTAAGLDEPAHGGVESVSRRSIDAVTLRDFRRASPAKRGLHEHRYQGPGHGRVRDGSNRRALVQERRRHRYPRRTAGRTGNGQSDGGSARRRPMVRSNRFPCSPARPSRSARSWARSRKGPRSRCGKTGARRCCRSRRGACAGKTRRADTSSVRTEAEPAPVMPSVRRIAAETGLQPANVAATGQDGRVTKGDMLAALESRAAERARNSRPRPLPPARGRTRRAKNACA